MVPTQLRSRLSLTALFALATFGLHAFPSMAQHYLQTNLTADQSGFATNTDVNLVNPWGMSRSAGSPWWISDNGTGLSTLYNATGAAQPLVVTIPTGNAGQSPTGTPTGTVFNGGTGFALAPGKPALFLFVTEDGTISGWNPGVNAGSAVIKVPAKLPTNGESVFKGAALASLPDGKGGMVSFLYVTDFRAGRVRVYDEWFHQIFSFDDDHLPHGFAPFNIQNIGGELYVTFGMQDSQKHDEVDGAGLGYVEVFSLSGRLLRRLEHGWWLNGPWGLVMASGDFGMHSHDLLVGQFGSGNIAAYDPVTGRFKGLLRDSSNNAIAINGLWGISVGGGGTSGSATALYFTAGSDDEAHGLFGTITPVENTGGNSN